MLTRTLAALPDDWTLLCARQLGDDPSCTVDAVLVHPEIGLALVNLAPGEPGAAVAVLREQLEREGFAQYFPGDLPIVALSIPCADVDEAGERLADAFEKAPRLGISDMDWADAVIELLLVPDDMAMAGLGETTGAAASAAAGSGEMVEEDEAEEAEAAFTAEAMARSAPVSGGRPKPSAFAIGEEEPEAPWRLVADEPATAFYDRQSRHGRWAAVAAAVVLVLGLGAGAWQLAEESGSRQPSESAGTPEAQVPIAQSAPNAGASANLAQPAPLPSPPVRLAAKNPAKAPPPPPVPTRIDPLPAPKPPVQMAAKNFAEAPPPPPAPTKIEPLPQPTPPTPAAVANAPTRAPAPSAATPPPAERQVAVGPQPPRQKPRRAAQQDETPVRQLMERQIDRAPAVAAQESRAPVREARAHPPIDAGDLPPLEEGASTAPSRETAVAPAPAPATAASPVGPPIRLLGGPGAPAPASGNTVPTTPAATAGANGSNPRECRPYTADTTLSGGRAPVQGIACRGADGQWRLVSEVPAR